MWTQDAKGIVTRTWYDLLGRTILEAENWKDIENLAPAGDSYTTLTYDDQNPSTTTDYSGPIRYTAQHYTRGGLMDMMVAIIPTPAQPGDIVNLEPDDIVWTEDAAQDYAATALADPSTFDFQATRYVYKGKVYNESDTLDSAGLPVSTFPMLLAEIQYPHKTTGLPDPTDALKFTWTLTGHVASRTDQRGVTLRYGYGDCDLDVGTDVDLDPSVDQLACVDVTYPSPNNGPVYVDSSIDHLECNYDSAGRSSRASTFGPNASGTIVEQSKVDYFHDAFGNLTKETLDPLGTADPDFIKSTQYAWEWSPRSGSTTRHALRLNTIQYPQTGSIVKLDFEYGAGNSTEDLINRVTKLQDGAGSNLITYARSGDGSLMRRVWGTSQNLRADYASTGTLDPFGRVKHLKFVNTNYSNYILQEYKYDYDFNGNRKYAEIRQPMFPNNRSWMYGYDRLNRLVWAEKGKINGSFDGFNASPAPTGLAWGMDVLGNWKGLGGATPWDGLSRYNVGQDNPSTQLGFDPEEDHVTYAETHTVNLKNQITHRVIDATGEDSGAAVTSNFGLDAAGNTVFDGVRFITYDAWNRVAKVHPPSGVTVGGKNNVTQGPTFGPMQVNRYDALGRKLTRQDSGSTAPNVVYYYDGHRTLEEYSITGSQAQETAVDGPRPTLASQLMMPQIAKRYFYGVDYFNEVVAVDPTGFPPHLSVLQDANWNVVGVADSVKIVEQKRYEPYGDFEALENVTYDAANPPNATGAPSFLATPAASKISLGIHGMTFDPITGLYCTPSGRCLDPKTGHWLQKDPLDTGFEFAVSLIYHGRYHRPMPAVLAGEQYANGMGIYGFLGSNPNMGTDAMGLRWSMNASQEMDALILDIMGERSAAAAHVMRNLQAFMNTSYAITKAAGQTYLAAVCPAYGLYMAYKGLQHDLATLDERGWDIWTGISLAANLAGGAADAIRLARQVGAAASAIKFSRQKAVRNYDPPKITDPDIHLPWMDGPKNTRVYVATDQSGNVIYVGISRQKGDARALQHARDGRGFANVEPIGDYVFSKNQAHAIEQAIMENKYGVENINNSIDPSHDWYLEAVQWGEAWLSRNAPQLLQ